MKGINCGNEVPDNVSLCPKCNHSLYGPRSIDLNDLGGGSNTIQSNNITSITGIDIKDIAPIQGPSPIKQTPVFNDNNKNDSKNKVGTIVLLLVIGCLLALSIYLFIQNRNLKTELRPQEPIVTPPAVDCEECVQGYYGLTNTYSFLLPNNWIYSQTANETVLTNNTVSMLIFKPAVGKVDHITAESLKNEYISQGYPIVTVEEATLSSRKVMFVSFNANNMNFVDFYYQYDSEKIIVGQISSSLMDVLTEDTKNIISSITIQTRENNITVGKAPLQYEKIISLLN